MNGTKLQSQEIQAIVMVITDKKRQNRLRSLVVSNSKTDACAENLGNGVLLARRSYLKFHSLEFLEMRNDL